MPSLAPSKQLGRKTSARRLVPLSGLHFSPMRLGTLRRLSSSPATRSPPFLRLHWTVSLLVRAARQQASNEGRVQVPVLVDEALRPQKPERSSRSSQAFCLKRKQHQITEALCLKRKPMASQHVEQERMESARSKCLVNDGDLVKISGIRLSRQLAGKLIGEATSAKGYSGSQAVGVVLLDPPGVILTVPRSSLHKQQLPELVAAAVCQGRVRGTSSSQCSGSVAVRCRNFGVVCLGSACQTCRKHDAVGSSVSHRCDQKSWFCAHCRRLPGTARDAGNRGGTGCGATAVRFLVARRRRRQKGPP